ncbi:MAG: chlorophyllide a reductase subunit Z [Chloroflexota bacterium]
MPKIIRDLSDTSSYWAAVWTICPMPDVHVICDAPIGCFNLVATAVPDYTDAVPHIENITPSVIREQEVGGSGTGTAVLQTYEGLRDEGVLEGKQLIVVSTAESEMIGSDLSDLVTKLQPGTTYFHSESLSDDEWVGRDRVLQWLWENYGAEAAADIEVEKGLVNIIGPTYGCFNSPSDLHEIKRMIEGAGGQVNLVFPIESKLSDIANLAKAEVNVLLYKEFGHTLADTLGQPWLHAPMGIRGSVDFVEQLGELLGTASQAKAFIKEEKRTTLQAVWDLWKGPQGDWFPTAKVGLVGSETYVAGLETFLGDELGMQIAFRSGRPVKPGEMDNEAVRQFLHREPPTFVFGSINEKIYLSEAGARFTNYIPAAFPGPVVRRAVGTPFMGFRGTVYVVQEIVNRLYDVLFNFLPVDGAYARQNGSGMSNGQGGPPSASTNQPGNLPWQSDAKDLLDRALEKLPFIPRISASREWQMKVEALAHQNEMSEVTADLVAEVLG